MKQGVSLFVIIDEDLTLPCYAKQPIVNSIGDAPEQLQMISKDVVRAQAIASF
jgi:hypothetical protein